MKRLFALEPLLIVAYFAILFPVSASGDAQTELFAGRFEDAAALYAGMLARQNPDTDAWYGLVRAELGLHHAQKAYAAAEEALKQAPQSAGAQTAAGLAMYRRGDLVKAESHFRAALRINPDYPGALRGMASIYTSVSMFKSAREMRLKAYARSPNDPELMIVHAATLNGPERIAALVGAMALLDPSSHEAKNVWGRLANDRAIGSQRLGRLVSPYETTQVKLYRIMDGPQHPRGVGLHLRFNGKQTAKLMIDTGASGISLSPKLAEKAGLRIIEGATSEVKGIGDQGAQTSAAYMASEVRAGDVVFADYPVSAFRTAKSSDFDGLIGADVFERFLVKIDFVNLLMSLEARPEGAAPPTDEPVDWNGKPTPGFHRVFRFGDHLAVPTSINGGPSTLFLIDSGTTANMIDTATAKQYTSVYSDSHTKVKGIQGTVDKASIARRVSLVFAGFRQDNNDLIAIDLQSMNDAMGVGYSGILGMPMLGNLAVTFDYLKGAIKFEYKKP